jgi:hypothetical protein
VLGLDEEAVLPPAEVLPPVEVVPPVGIAFATQVKFSPLSSQVKIPDDPETLQALVVVFGMQPV